MLIPGLIDKYSTTPDEAAKANDFSVSWGEHMGASVREGFEHTTTDMLLTEQRVRSAEDKAYRDQSPSYQSEIMADSFGGVLPREAGGKTPEFISREDWNDQHEYFRKGVEWREGMTPERARIYAEDFDKREWRRELLARGEEKYGFLAGTLPGFFAGMLGNLPDPVNLIPFGGGALAASRATGRAAVMAGVKAGAVEGVLSNLAVDALVLPSLKARGDDITFADYALDGVFGAALGGIFGGAGGWLGRRRADRAALDAARMNVHGQPRQALLNAFELAVDDVANGRPVDVGQVAGIREAIGKAYDAVLRDPTGGPADEVLAVLRSPEFERVLLERGPSAHNAKGEFVVRGGNIAAQGYDASGFGLVKIIWRHGEKSKADPKFQVRREDVMALPEMLSAHTPESSGPRSRTMRWVVPGEDGVSLVAVVGKRKGSDTPTTITLFKTDDVAKYPTSPKREAPASPDRRNPQRGQRHEGDTAEGTFGRDQQGQGLEETVSPDAPEVKPFREYYREGRGTYNDWIREHVRPEAEFHVGASGFFRPTAFNTPQS
ncbi:MAG: hypothetical protein LBQ10_09610 [Desulfovibrio sp.]|jgi:hypothetical protein|nr:hypothetical protein [Desulfovibrio sp.]